MTGNEDLASFDDRLTLRFVRTYPHGIEAVWDAVSTGEQLDVWLLPASQVERRQGGRCSFSWGAPATNAVHGTVSVFEAPHRVRYQWPDGGYLQFNLEELDRDTTRLTFLYHTAPGANLDPDDGTHAGMDQPAGPDSPWRPGVVGGFHGFLDQLDLFLSVQWTRVQAQHAIQTVYAGRSLAEAWAENPGCRAPANDPTEHQRLTELYRSHIKEHCPRA